MRLFTQVLLLLNLLSMTAHASLENLKDGKSLYELNCISCHESTIHIRQKTLVKTPEDLLTQVNRWQTNLSLGWTDAEISAVASYLNNTYYHFNSTE